MKMPLDDLVFVEDDREYLQNKGNGGKSNRRGYQYEMRYGAWELIKLAYRVRNERLNPLLVTITSQMQCYIDDLVIEDGDTALYFEMKSGDSITWGDSKTEKTLSWNFKRQKDFDRRHRQLAQYHLVLAEPERQRVLGESAPASVTVIGFPFTYAVTRIAASEKTFITTISDLLDTDAKNAALALLAGPCRFHYRFDRNDVYLAFCYFNTVYDMLEAATPRLLHDILEDADFVSRGSLSYAPKEITDRLRRKILEINGVSAVETCNGVLFIRTIFGVLTQFPAAVGSAEFREFATAVMAEKISDVDALQEWMLKV